MPLDLISDNRNRPSGITVRGVDIEADEIQLLDGMPVTTPLRTALDLACWYPRGTAMQTVDALARATSIDAVDALSWRSDHPGRRGIRAARENLDLVDSGAESPKETWLRLS